MFGDVLKQYAIARHTLAEVDEALGFSLSKLIEEGPAEELTLTANAQPAIMAVSVASQRVLAQELGFDPVTGDPTTSDLGTGDPTSDPTADTTSKPVKADPTEKTSDTKGAAKGVTEETTHKTTPTHKATLVAGHSLGEWTALVATKSLALADAARLLRLRGEAMQKAVPVGEGAMVAILGGDAADAIKGTEAVIANHNCPGQEVISGAATDVATAAAKAKASGAKAIPLKVSVPFHSPLMEPVVAVLAEALAKTELATPRVEVVSNVTATAQKEPQQIKSLLATQAKSPVRWQQSLEYMAANGITCLFELAPGGVLSGLAKRTLGEKVETVSMRNLEEVKTATEKLTKVRF